MCLRLDTRARCIEHAYTVRIHHKAANQRRNAVEERQRSEVMDFGHKDRGQRRRKARTLNTRYI